MKHIIFMIFSSLESFSIIFLGLVLFRKRIKANLIIKSMIIGTILAAISLILRQFGADTISPLIQLLFMILFTGYLFKEKFIKSIFISISGYLLFAVIQAVLIILTNYYGLISFSELKPYTLKGEIIQLSSFVLVISVIYVIKRTNEGYAFDPEESTGNNRIRYSNKVFLFIISTSLILLSSAFYEYKTSGLAFSILTFFILSALSSVAFLYASLKRDQEESKLVYSTKEVK